MKFESIGSVLEFISFLLITFNLYTPFSPIIKSEVSFKFVPKEDPITKGSRPEPLIVAFF